MRGRSRFGFLFLVGMPRAYSNVRAKSPEVYSARTWRAGMGFAYCMVRAMTHRGGSHQSWFVGNLESRAINPKGHVPWAMGRSQRVCIQGCLSHPLRMRRKPRLRAGGDVTDHAVKNGAEPWSATVGATHPFPPLGGHHDHLSSDLFRSFGARKGVR